VQGSGPRPAPQHPSGSLPRPNRQPNGQNGQNSQNGQPTGPRPQPNARQQQAAVPPALQQQRPPAPPAAAPTPAADAPVVRAARPIGPTRREDMDPISLTTEMEPIGEAVQQIRRVDATLARFSAVHDELAEEERLKKEKRQRLMPWLKEEGEDDEEPDVLAVTGAEQLGHPAEGPDVSEEDEEDEEDTERLAPLNGTPPPRRRVALAGRVAAAAIAGILLVSTGVVWGTKRWVDNQFQEVEALDQNSADIKEGAKQLGDENFLLVGSDTREGAAAEDGVGDTKGTPGARSDTVMIAHIPKNRKRVVMVSFPRDMEIQRPSCDRWDSKTGKYSTEQSPASKNQKLNTAFQVGGPKCVTKVIQNLSGLKINHFVGIDFNGFKGMVDAVQGVEVCVEKPIFDTTLNTWIVQEAGKAVKLQGDQALNFVRARHVRGDPTSDYGRMQRQQRFLSALLRKAMSSQVLLDPGKLTDFIGAFAKATFGEGIGTDQLITLGRSLQNLGAGRITFITVPTTRTPNDRGNEVLRDRDNQNLFNAIINDQPLPGEEPLSSSNTPQAQAQPPPPDSLTAPAELVDPKTVKIQVLNGGNTKDGVARRAATDLGKLGFQVMRTDASPDKVPQTVVRYGDRADAARTLAAAVPGSKLEQDASLGSAVILVIGPEFNGKIVTPKADGSGAPPGQTAPPQLPKDLSTVNAGDVSCA
jgi:LCP family protein required for cell wall assembly